MKYATLLLVALPSLASAAPDNRYAHCSQEAPRAEMRAAVSRDLKLRTKALDPAMGAYSFKLGFLSNFEDGSNLSVYFEQTTGPFEPRFAYVAQYGVNAETCALEFRKMRPLVAEATALPPENYGDACNEPARAESLRTEIRALVLDLSTNVMAPGCTAENFSFTDVHRQSGTGDITVVATLSRPGLLPSSNFSQFTVDPQTCKPRYVFGTTLKE